MKKCIVGQRPVHWLKSSPNADSDSQDMSFVYHQIDSREQPCFGRPGAGNGSKEGRRSHGEVLSPMTYDPSTSRGMKSRTLRPIELAGERLPPNAPNGTGGTKSKAKSQRTHQGQMRVVHHLTLELLFTTIEISAKYEKDIETNFLCGW